MPLNDFYSFKRIIAFFPQFTPMPSAIRNTVFIIVLASSSSCWLRIGHCWVVVKGNLQFLKRKSETVHILRDLHAYYNYFIKNTAFRSKKAYRVLIINRFEFSLFLQLCFLDYKRSELLTFLGMPPIPFVILRHFNPD